MTRLLDWLRGLNWRMPIISISWPRHRRGMPSVAASREDWERIAEECGADARPTKEV